jgi:hypothetical protein
VHQPLSKIGVAPFEFYVGSFFVQVSTPSLCVNANDDFHLIRLSYYQKNDIFKVPKHPPLMHSLWSVELASAKSFSHHIAVRPSNALNCYYAVYFLIAILQHSTAKA